MKIEVTQGQNIIQILYDEFVSCLKIKQALAINWPDCAGSVGEYYSVSYLNSELRQKLTNNLNSVLLDGTEDEIDNSIKVFLNLFQNGNYRITKEELLSDKFILCHEESVSYNESIPIEERFSGWFFPYPYDKQYLIFTRPKQSIDESRIEYYINLIKNGNRPKVVVVNLFSIETSAETATYILDGHHKIIAYKKLHIEIPVIRITKIQQKQNNTTEIIESSEYFLKANEMNHLILENDENIEKVNFLQNQSLTQLLDKALVATKRPGIGLTKLLVAIKNIKSQESNNWVKNRINKLKGNKYLGYGLCLNTKVLNDKKEIEYWGNYEIKSTNDIDEWAKVTLHNTR